MGMEVAWVFLLMHCFAHSDSFRSSAEFGAFSDPEREWDEMEKVIASEAAQEFAPKTKLWKLGLVGPSIPKANKVPLYRRVSASECQKKLFEPERGARPLPDSVKEMLLVTAAPVTPTTASRPKLFEVLCHIDRMYVRVRREYFDGVNSYERLKLGGCPVNQATVTHYYLLYLLKDDCGFQIQSNVDDVTFRTELSFQPDPDSPIMREKAFIINVQCRYHRFFNIYSVGFYPKLLGGTVFKGLKGKTGVVLIAQDVLGNEVPAGEAYTTGKPMCFEAKLSDQASTQRLYVNMCVITTSQDPNSSPKYTVINNQGCMIDAMSSSQSKFVTPNSKTSQKFCIGAFIFKGMGSSSGQQVVQQLYMHCEIFLGNPTSTESAKACNYDSSTKMWSAVAGDNAVCSCCSSLSCSSAQPRAFKTMVSSHPWKIDYRQKSSYVAPEPQFKASGMADDADFHKFWDQDY